MIRALRPTDLLTLTYFQRRATPNLARSRDLLSRSDTDPGTAGLLLADWRIPPRRHTFVATEGRRLQGLLSVRRGATRQSWEVDRLLTLAGDSGEPICEKLLSQSGPWCAHRGIKRVYLRLPAGHPVLAAASRAGFTWYSQESVYSLPVAGGTRGVRPPGLRHREPADDHAVYRLYNVCVPARVRASEAVTFQDWLALQPLSPERRAEQWVLDQGRDLAAWIRVSQRERSGLLDILYLAEAEPVLPALLDFGLTRLAGQSQARLRVPAYLPALERILDERGASRNAELAVFVKQLAVREALPRFVPAPA